MRHARGVYYHHPELLLLTDRNCIIEAVHIH
jgi:hypothetical protein